jgi:NodT family efflux transporter outer membrane factor (OMF) lipoprotein
MSSAGAKPPVIRRSTRCVPPVARSLPTVIWAMLAACTVGPNFKPPESPSTTRYLAASEGAAEAATSQAPRQTIALGQKVTTEWWALLKSPELNSLVAQAIEDSRTLESARARLAQARDSVAAASSALYPQVSLNAGASRERLNAASFGLNQSAFPLPPNFNLLQVGGTASYSLDLFGGTRRRIEQQSALEEFQSDQLGATYLSLTGNIIMEAIEIASLRAQSRAIGDILEIDRQNLDLVRKARLAGAVPDSDVITVETQLATDETLEPAIDQQLSAAGHALAVLVGKPPGDWSPPEFDLTRLALPTEIPVELPSELVHQRPDIRAAEAQLHAASAQIGIATAELYPDVTLSASGGSAALHGGQLFNVAGLVWSIAAGITQPVFDGGLRRAERRAALQAFRGSAADYQQTVLVAFGQVADLLKALEHDRTLLDSQRYALEMATQSVSLQRISYGSGGSGIIGLLDAQRQHEQALLGVVRAQAQQYQDTTQLFVAMGGGWWRLSSIEGSKTARRDRAIR